jgi:hypothetical protein
MAGHSEMKFPLSPRCLMTGGILFEQSNNIPERQARLPAQYLHRLISRPIFQGENDREYADDFYDLSRRRTLSTAGFHGISPILADSKLNHYLI